MTAEIDHWIDGRSHGGRGARIDVHDPATGEVVGRVACADAADVDAAVVAAQKAAEEWGARSVAARSAVVAEFGRLARANQRELAHVVVREHGKVLADAVAEVTRGLEVVDFAVGAGTHLRGSASMAVSTDVDCSTFREPLGVVAGITPFNFPIMVPMWMYPVAIVAGNAFILKPSEKAPSASNLIADLWAEAGLPAGVFNVVHGGQSVVEGLLAHPGVAAVSFVGSTPVAKAVYANGAAAGKRVQALGGAKNHAVVLADADLSAAADAVVSAGYGSTGQRCMAISVVVAVEEIADRLVEEIAQRAGTIRVGVGSDPAAEMGPLVSAEHLARVRRLVDSGIDDGAELVVDGRHAPAPAGGGYFLGPCLFDRVEPGMSIYDEEVFGPVLCVVRVPDAESALQLVNRSPYGNGAVVFTTSGVAAHAFRARVTAGMVGINVAIPVPVGFYSFGGWKSSLFGSHNIYGPDGIAFYTRTKTVTERWPEHVGSTVTTTFPTAG